MHNLYHQDIPQICCLLDVFLQICEKLQKRVAEYKKENEQLEEMLEQSVSFLNLMSLDSNHPIHKDRKIR